MVISRPWRVEVSPLMTLALWTHRLHHRLRDQRWRSWQRLGLAALEFYLATSKADLFRRKLLRSQRGRKYSVNNSNSKQQKLCFGRLLSGISAQLTTGYLWHRRLERDSNWTEIFKSCLIRYLINFANNRNSQFEWDYSLQYLKRWMSSDSVSPLWARLVIRSV